MHAMSNQLTDFIRENQERLYLFAYSYMKNKEDALDMVQTAILKSFSSISTLREKTYLKTWFYKILINSCLSELANRKKAVPTVPAALSEIQGGGETPEKDLYPSASLDLDLHEAIETLDPKAKAIIILRFFEDMKIPDVGKALDMNENTVKTILYRTLKELKVKLKD